MKYFLFTLCVLPFLSFNQGPASYHTLYPTYTDTGHIAHVIDGLITEWPAERFHISDDSTVEYAIDNDAQNLYVAMTIPDFGEQTKIMKNGMKFFIDLKGKKKEGKGVEFPIKGEGNSASGNAPTVNGPGITEDPAKKLDKKTQRSLMSLGLVALKIFGMGTNDQEEQGLMMPGSVNIAFKWDESDAMHFEYRIPLSLLGDISSLNEKDISIGWKINGFEKPQGEHHSGGESGGEGGGGYSRGMHGGGGGGRGQYPVGGGRGVGMRPPTAYKKIDPEEMRKEQNFWTKYVISIPSSQKAF